MKIRVEPEELDRDWIIWWPSGPLKGLLFFSSEYGGSHQKDWSSGAAVSARCF